MSGPRLFGNEAKVDPPKPVRPAVNEPGRRVTERSILEDRLAHLTWAAVSLSEGGRLAIEQIPTPGGYRNRTARQSVVTVWWDGHSHRASSDPDIDHVNIYEALVVAMDRAVAWLRHKVRGA